MGISRGSALTLPVFDFDTGAAVEDRPATGLIFGDDGGSTPVTTLAGLPSINTRRDGFIAANAGRRFTITNDAIVPVTGQIGFLDTTPTFLLRQAASTKRVVLRTINLGLAAGAGGSFRVAIVIDTTDRYVAASGTPATPQNVNTDSVVPSAITGFFVNPTATAAGAGTRIISNVALPVSLGSNVEYNFADGLLIGKTGSLLVYATSTIASAPSLLFTFEFEQID